MLEEEIPSGAEIYTEGDECEYIIFIIEGNINIEMLD
jgi:hypothetical protein